jgi:hypothetical protein
MRIGQPEIVFLLLRMAAAVYAAWSAFFERVDWKGGIDSAQKLFEEQLPTSPDPKSATRDWNATRKNLFIDKTLPVSLRAARRSFIASFRSPGGGTIAVCSKVSSILS